MRYRGTLSWRVDYSARIRNVDSPLRAMIKINLLPDNCGGRRASRYVSYDQRYKLTDKEEEAFQAWMRRREFWAKARPVVVYLTLIISLVSAILYMSSVVYDWHDKAVKYDQMTKK
jgi:Fe2+ transport system protein B